MGGKLLENCTRRQSLAEYKEKTSELLETFTYAEYASKFRRVEVIKAVREKDSFGDADILYSTEDDHPFTVADLDADFNPKEIHKNGDVISFEYREMQVDMIHVKKAEFKYARSYFAWNDAGNFIGKLTRYFGLSHGHDGLYIKMRDENDNFFAKVLVTHDHDETLKFVGLDPKVFNAGFDNMQQVFEYVATSPYYNPENYLLENISSIGRVRDRKRPNYGKFLEFGKTQTGPFLPKVKDKSIFLDKIFKFFPGTEERFHTALSKMIFAKEVKQKFNGYIVNELTGLNGKQLGEFMSELRKDPMFNPNIIVYSSFDKIADRIRAAYSTHKSRCCIIDPSQQNLKVQNEKLRQHANP